MCRPAETPIERISAAVDDTPTWLARQNASALGEFIAKGRAAINGLEAAIGEATRRFERTNGYRIDGAASMVAWMQQHGKLSGAQAAQRVEVARQLGQLPRTEEALARGEIGFEHAATMARTASHVGLTEVRKAEVALLEQAEAMDPGQFVNVAKQFEHRVDAEAALTEANRAYERRYFQIGAPSNGLVRLEGQVTTEQGAVIRTAMEPLMKPSKHDDRTPGQRAADALTDICRGTNHDGSMRAGTATHAPRVLLIVRATVDTLAKIAGAPAAELDGGGTIPAESARRLACDSAVTRITGLNELEWEMTHAARTIPPALRRMLVLRDRHCVFPGCDRPASWCDGHHLKFWADGGPTTLANLGLLCKAHHRKVHEEGFQLIHQEDGRWRAVPPSRSVETHARSR